MIDYGKSQAVRLWDVWILGPALIWLGTRERRQLNSVEAGLLAAVGLGVIIYNGRNYVRIARGETPAGNLPSPGVVPSVSGEGPGGPPEDVKPGSPVFPSS